MNSEVRNGFWRGWSTLERIQAIFDLFVVVFTGGLLWTSVQQWHAMDAQRAVMQSQLDQMKFSGVQTDNLVSETHGLAVNGGTQATNTANEVSELSRLVSATNQQSRYSMQQAKTLRQQLDASDRPWIRMFSLNSHVMWFSGPLTDSPVGNVIFTIGGDIKNIGRSPAVDLRINVRTIVRQMDYFNRPGAIYREEMAVCNIGPTTGPEMVLFPNEEYRDMERSSVVTLDKRNITVRNGHEYFAAIVIGCIDYRSAPSVGHHHTALVYKVMGGPGIEEGMPRGWSLFAINQSAHGFDGRLEQMREYDTAN